MNTLNEWEKNEIERKTMNITPSVTLNHLSWATSVEIHTSPSLLVHRRDKSDSKSSFNYPLKKRRNDSHI